MTPARRLPDLLTVYPHLTGRDRHLLQLLDDHRVLTTSQLHRVFFQALRTCQLRLLELRTLGLVERFRYPRPAGGSNPWHWTLGPHGARFQAAAHHQPAPTPRATHLAIERLAANPHLPHLVATNELFVQLAHHARSHPRTRLRRWWSEQRASREFHLINPDGHGVWSSGDHTVGFFVECDQGTEPHHRILTKLAAYQRLAHTNGAAYPVLLWLTNPDREQRLHHTLTQHPTVTVATATHDHDPAGAVWLPLQGHRRVALHELPSFHGHPHAANPNYLDGQLLLGDHFLDPVT